MEDGRLKKMKDEMRKNEIRALFDQDTIIVYQAYRKEIAIPAIKNQKFVSPFKIDRMTWIKPSFLWMMYRSGWAKKEGQEYILAIRIKREGFDWALNNSCLSHYNNKYWRTEEDWKIKLSMSPVRIQWDPEKDIYLNNLNYRSIQVGLKDIAVTKYVNEWIVSIENITDRCTEIYDLIQEAKMDDAMMLLPKEDIYMPQNGLIPFS